MWFISNQTYKCSIRELRGEPEILLRHKYNFGMPVSGIQALFKLLQRSRRILRKIEKFLFLMSSKFSHCCHIIRASWNLSRISNAVVMWFIRPLFRFTYYEFPILVKIVRSGNLAEPNPILRKYWKLLIPFLVSSGSRRLKLIRWKLGRYANNKEVPSSVYYIRWTLAWQLHYCQSGGNSSFKERFEKIFAIIDSPKRWRLIKTWSIEGENVKCFVVFLWRWLQRNQRLRRLFDVWKHESIFGMIFL